MADMAGAVAKASRDEAGAADEAEATVAAHMALREVMLSDKSGLLHRGDGLIAAAADIACASCNSIHVHGSEADGAELASLIERFVARGLPFSVNMRSSLAKRFAPLAKAAGLAHQADLPLMTLKPAEFRPVACPHDLLIRTLPGEAEGVHLPLIVETLHLSPAGMARLLSCANRASPAWATYVGEVDGELAVTGTAIVGPLGAGLICIATDPRFGRRGFGGALTSTAIADAFARGAPRVLLHASEQGIGLYRRLGFRTVEHLSVFGAGPDRPTPAG